MIKEWRLSELFSALLCTVTVLVCARYSSYTPLQVHLSAHLYLLLYMWHFLNWNYFVLVPGFFVYFISVVLSLVASISIVSCPERLVSEITCYVSRWMLLMSQYNHTFFDLVMSWVFSFCQYLRFCIRTALYHAAAEIRRGGFEC